MTEDPDQQIRALQEKAGQALSDAELLLENGCLWRQRSIVDTMRPSKLLGQPS